MRCRFGIGERTIGKAQSLVDPTEDPQCEGVPNLSCGAGIRAEPVGEIAMTRLVVELETLLIMVMGAGKVAETKAGVAEVAVRDHSLGTIRPGRRFAQEQLGHFAHRLGFATIQMTHPKTVIGGEPYRAVFLPARQFAGARKGRARFRGA